MPTTLIIPGLNSSGPTHWQTWLEARIPDAVRVIQRDWDTPNLTEWTSRIRHEIARSSGRFFVVAHSFGALAAAQAANDLDNRIAGALLVAPADPDKFKVADYLPTEPLAFPTILVASSNDPWMPFDRARFWANLWDADFIDLGAAGHINTAAGFGPWPQGLLLIERLRSIVALRSTKANAQRTAISIAPSRRRPRAANFGISSLARTRFADDRRDLKQAAALLEDAGWLITPPRYTAHVSRT